MPSEEHGSVDSHLVHVRKPERGVRLAGTVRQPVLAVAGHLGHDRFDVVIVHVGPLAAREQLPLHLEVGKPLPVPHGSRRTRAQVGRQDRRPVEMPVVEVPVGVDDRGAVQHGVTPLREALVVGR